MINEILKDWTEKESTAVEGITEKFDTFYSGKHNDLNPLIEFLNFNKRVVMFLVEMAEVNSTANISHNTKYKGIERLLGYYSCISLENPKESRKWLINGLVLIIADGYEYKPPFFIRGKERILHTSITKNGTENPLKEIVTMYNESKRKLKN